MKKRLNEIASYEVLLCIFVVMIHALSECIEKLPRGTALSTVAFCISRSMTFVVPAFIISAGAKFANKFKNSKLNYFSFIRGRVLRIYLPYVLIAVIYYLYFVYRLRWFSFNSGQMLEYVGLGTIAAPFYFIVVIMQFYILAPLWLACYKNLTWTAGVSFAVIVTAGLGFVLKDFPYGDRIFTAYLMYWIIGCYIGGDFDYNMQTLRRNGKIIIPLGIIFTITYTAMAFGEFCGKSYGYLTELSKIVFSTFASLAYLVVMPKREIFFSEKMAPLTYYVYLIHCLVIFEVNHLMSEKGIDEIWVRFLIRMVSVYIVSFLVAFLYSKLKKIKISRQ